MDLMVMPFDDFDVMASNDFLMVIKVAIVPYQFGSLISDKR